MWVKTLEGKLVNMDNVFTVAVRPVRAVQTLPNSEVIGFAATAFETGPESAEMSVGAINLCWFKGAPNTEAGGIAKDMALDVIDTLAFTIATGKEVTLVVIGPEEYGDVPYILKEGMLP